MTAVAPTLCLVRRAKLLLIKFGCSQLPCLLVSCWGGGAAKAMGRPAFDVLRVVGAEAWWPRRCNRRLRAHFQARGSDGSHG